MNLLTKHTFTLELLCLCADIKKKTKREKRGRRKSGEQRKEATAVLIGSFLLFTALHSLILTDF